MAFTFDIKGIEGLEKKLQEHAQQVEEKVSGILITHVTDINRQQIANAQRFTDRSGPGILQSLDFEPKVPAMNYELVCNAPHAAYLEFGTKLKFQPIAGVDASPYRGGTGNRTGKTLYQLILEWAKRKNIGGTFTKSGAKSRSKKSQEAVKQAAWLIYRSILKNGIKPQPFFFGPFLEKRQLIIDEVKQAISTI